MPGALPPDVIGPDHFPKVFAWIERFRKAVADRKKELGEGVKRKPLKGEKAASEILGSPFREELAENSVDNKDPVVAAEGLGKGVNVRLWPTDTGVLHKETGRLVAFNKNETVIETLDKSGDVLVRLHAPRHGFRVRKTEGNEAKL